MSKTYIIRKVAYGYTDEHHYVRSTGAIVDTFDNETDAYNRLVELEVSMFRSYDLGDFEHFSPYGRAAQEYREQRAALDAYLKAEFGESWFITHPHTDARYMPHNIYLPAPITDEQIMKIRELSGLQFYVMRVFDDTPMFYAIWLPYSDDFYRVTYAPRPDAIFFYNSYDEALAHAGTLDFVWQAIDRIPPASLEDFSDQPGLLRAFIENTDGIIYDEAKQKIDFRYNFKSENLPGLNALLKQPLFEIREFPYEQAKDIPHDVFEIM